MDLLKKIHLSAIKLIATPLTSLVNHDLKGEETNTNLKQGPLLHGWDIHDWSLNSIPC